MSSVFPRDVLCSPLRLFLTWQQERWWRMDELIHGQLLSQIPREFLLGMYKLVQVLDGL